MNIPIIYLNISVTVLIILMNIVRPCFRHLLILLIVILLIVRWIHVIITSIFPYNMESAITDFFFFINSAVTHYVSYNNYV